MQNQMLSKKTNLINTVYQIHSVLIYRQVWIYNSITFNVIYWWFCLFDEENKELQDNALKSMIFDLFEAVIEFSQVVFLSKIKI